MDALAGGLQIYWNERIVAQAGAWATRLVLAIIAAIVVSLLARFALRATRRALARTRAHANARLLIDRLIEVAFLLAGGLWVLTIFGVQLTALVAAVGIAGLAVSLALQDLLKNLVAGLYILVERPFTIGEHIEFKTFSGTVETIELRTTALRTMAGQRVVIPNAMLFAEALVNRSAYGGQLVKLRVTLPVAGPQDGQAGPDQADGQEQPASPADTLRAALRAAGGRMEPERQPEQQGETGPPGPTGPWGSPALATGSEPAVMVESLTAEKVTLRAEVWASDARTAAARLAWALRECLPRAEITVLE